jgi:Mrp family chromosome partitioning ATPase
MTLMNPSPQRSRPGTAIKPLRSVARLAHSTLFDRDDLLMLYQSVLPQLNEDRPAILVVTSAAHGEGVSTVTRELGQVVAGDLGQAVLLISASPEMEGASGLEEVIEGALPFDRAIEPDINVPLLYHTHLCTRGSHASLLFNSSELDRALNQALRFTKLVLVDAPPVMADVTALAFARRAAGVLLVVEAEKTRMSLVEQARRSIDGAGGRLCGVILNKGHQRIPRAISRRL